MLEYKQDNMKQVATNSYKGRPTQESPPETGRTFWEVAIVSLAGI